MDKFLFLPPELAMSTGTLTNEANAKTETQPLTVEKKKKKKNEKVFKVSQQAIVFLCFDLIKSLSFISSKRQFFISYVFN